MTVPNIPPDVSTPDQRIRKLMEKVRAEYAQMPGLCVGCRKHSDCGLLNEPPAKKPSAA